MFSADAYRAARERSVLIDRSDRGRLVVSGADRASYLQGLLTNDTSALKPGEGCYSAYLTPQGRMIADMCVYELGDLILLALSRHVKDTVLAKLDQFVFSEDVQIGDVTDTFFTTAVVGPDAERILSGVLGDPVVALPEHGNRRVRFDGHPAIMTRVTDLGEAGYDVYVEQAQAAAFRERLAGAGVVEADLDTAAAIRIEAGIPKFGRDMDEETIPLEAGIESRAISMSKGCYVGQEVIIRVLHRGHGRVARKLAGLVFEGDAVPATGATVTVEGRDIGRLTSATMSPALKRPIALAYLHREFLAIGTAVLVGGARAVVTELPFIRGTV